MAVVTARSIVELIDSKRAEVNEYKYAIQILSEPRGNITFNYTINSLKHQLGVAERELNYLLSKHYDTMATQ